MVLFLLGKTALYAMMIRTQATGAFPLKISLILPLFDRRNAGWKSFDPGAAPYTADQIRRERDLYR